MSSITVMPAIDLKGGRCVRLRQGLADQETVYGHDPVEMALHWQNEGGRYLHVVDLDGAFEGHPVHTEVIGQVVQALSIPVEVGGGLRNDDHVRQLVDVGVDRVILGTRAFSDPASLGKLVEQFGSKIAVGIDARDGKVQIKGWVETTDMLATDLARQVVDLGVQTLIYTDTATDGMLGGPNVNQMAAICDAVSCNVIASGGVSAEDHIRALAELQKPNLTGAIVGKALYEGSVTVAGLNQAAESA
jgi:phosphoribosylformimino-5-aminoimidazole carboxamide ribotide isomerase